MAGGPGVKFFLLIAEEDLVAAQQIIEESGKIDRSSLAVFPSQLLQGLPITERWTATSWYRIFLPELEPLKSVDRILLLGVDAYVVRIPWHALSCNFTESIAAVCEPRNSPGYSSPLFSAQNTTYLNSDVILYNTRAWKARGETARLVILAKAIGQLLPYSNQDVLNYWFRG
jgi:lipopolysaccharide biosynthesis glycosyltransferase